MHGNCAHSARLKAPHTNAPAVARQAGHMAGDPKQAACPLPSPGARAPDWESRSLCRPRLQLPEEPGKLIRVACPARTAYQVEDCGLVCRDLRANSGTVSHALCLCISKQKENPARFGQIQGGDHGFATGKTQWESALSVRTDGFSTIYPCPKSGRRFAFMRTEFHVQKRGPGGDRCGTRIGMARRTARAHVSSLRCEVREGQHEH